MKKSAPGSGAFRRSELVREPNGDRKLYFRAFTTGTSPSVEYLATQGDVIRPAEIKKWFAALKLVPTDWELSELTHLLNIMRVTRHPEEVVPNPPELESFAKALEVIVDSGPTLSAILRDALTSAGPHAKADDVLRKLSLLGRIKALVTDVHNLREDPSMMPKERFREETYWHRDIDILVHRLKYTADRLRKRISFTKDESPAVGFIADALKRAGIPATRPAVARACARRRKRPLAVYDRP